MTTAEGRQMCGKDIILKDNKNVMDGKRLEEKGESEREIEFIMEME